ncbi:MAG: cytochrome P450, partial [Saprospiraceae bacterium]|nr:cytochrome P450 [Saprospiraceae bacterium]
MKVPYRYPPLVPRWISIRNALKMVQNPIPILQENVRNYGKTYTFHIGGVQKGIVSIEPAFIQHVLQKNHRNYRKSNMQTHVLARYVGHGLLTSDGAYWLRQRRLIQPAFHRDRLEQIVRIMYEEIDAYFREHWTETARYDIYREMHTLAFRIVARALFSANISDEILRALSRQITEIQHFVTRRIRQPYLHAWFQVSGKMKRHDQLAEASRQILLQIIRERKQRGPGTDDLLDLLLSSRYEDTGEPMDEHQVLDESLILFVAGHETSANALTWTLYLLTQHPEYL